MGDRKIPLGKFLCFFRMSTAKRLTAGCLLASATDGNQKKKKASQRPFGNRSSTGNRQSHLHTVRTDGTHYTDDFYSEGNRQTKYMVEEGNR